MDKLTEIIKNDIDNKIKIYTDEGNELTLKYMEEFVELNYGTDAELREKLLKDVESSLTLNDTFEILNFVINMEDRYFDKQKKLGDFNVKIFSAAGSYILIDACLYWLVKVALNPYMLELEKKPTIQSGDKLFKTLPFRIQKIVINCITNNRSVPLDDEIIKNADKYINEKLHQSPMLLYGHCPKSYSTKKIIATHKEMMKIMSKK